ncbi:MAG: hypothetical protein ACM37W_22705 [Actinomycetota bacterium]
MSKQRYFLKLAREPLLQPLWQASKSQSIVLKFTSFARLIISILAQFQQTVARSWRKLYLPFRKSNLEGLILANLL